MLDDVLAVTGASVGGAGSVAGVDGLPPPSGVVPPPTGGVSTVGGGTVGTVGATTASSLGSWLPPADGFDWSLGVGSNRCVHPIPAR